MSKKSKSSIRKMANKELSSLVSKNMQQNPTPHGGDVLDPFSTPQPGDPSTQLYSNQQSED